MEEPAGIEKEELLKALVHMYRAYGRWQLFYLALFRPRAVWRCISCSYSIIITNTKSEQPTDRVGGREGELVNETRSQK